MANKLTEITHGFEYFIEKVFAGLSPNARQANIEFAFTNASYLREVIEKLDEHFKVEYPFALYKKSVIHACHSVCEYFSDELNGQQKSHSIDDLEMFVHYIELVIRITLKDSKPRPSVKLL
ncbi:hypothetical protein M2H12_22230 [Vibrio vulnificus]|nr:hypothetical protein [Vibrio vulnificus]MCU8172971.1 hypothetical protein [Vibrio vulnificus]